MSLSVLYTRGTTAPATALPEEGLPTQRVFSQGTRTQRAPWQTVRTGELHPFSLELWFRSMASLTTAPSHGALITGCLCTGARALAGPVQC